MFSWIPHWGMQIGIPLVLVLTLSAGALYRRNKQRRTSSLKLHGGRLLRNHYLKGAGGDTESRNNRNLRRQFRLDIRIGKTRGSRRWAKEICLTELDLFSSGVERGTVCLVALISGHGGSRAAKFVRDNLVPRLREDQAAFETNPTERLDHILRQIDEEFLELADRCIYEDGATVLVAIITHSQIIVGHVGDAQAVVCRAGQGVVLSPQHTVTNSEELSRINAVDAVIFANRYLGHPTANPLLFHLPMTRSIGDRMWKDPKFTDGKQSGLIGTPQTNSMHLGDLDEFLLLGSAAVWKAFSPQNVFTPLRRNPQNPVASLLRETISSVPPPAAVSAAAILVRFEYLPPV